MAEEEDGEEEEGAEDLSGDEGNEKGESLAPAWPPLLLLLLPPLEAGEGCAPRLFRVEIEKQRRRERLQPLAMPPLPRDGPPPHALSSRRIILG